LFIFNNVLLIRIYISPGFHAYIESIDIPTSQSVLRWTLSRAKVSIIL